MAIYFVQSNLTRHLRPSIFGLKTSRSLSSQSLPFASHMSQTTVEEADLKGLQEENWRLTKETGQDELEKTYYFKTYTKVAKQISKSPRNNDIEIWLPNNILMARYCDEQAGYIGTVNANDAQCCQLVL
ncbi:predicted protein [Plenodomus lingam JN3]|uniref:Predicted protein n=1 Tax=Leptosphaeria maculans (strain JN3 / isolate v23.1.3 / race Av1-4-5-6-7-8) TaxID=985895 RepID=E4ZUM8_LEPMJ|nr:predicted protein [Plenodomus lingam JN3]CBX95107.1 predicted protein [Plenodomus lingam JN3]